MQKEILVRQQGEPVLAPLGTPRILHDESLRRVPDQGDGVAIACTALALDERDPSAKSISRNAVVHINCLRRIRLIPSGVHHQRAIHYADFRNRGVDVADLRVRYSIERATWRAARVGGDGDSVPEYGLKMGDLADAIRPLLVGSHPVAMPPLHPTARGGSLVFLAWPFVITPGELVQHFRADRSPDVPPAQQKVDHRRQREPRAGALLPLIQNPGYELAVHDLIGK